MSFLEILGLIATITGIISFLKNDAEDLFFFFKNLVRIKKTSFSSLIEFEFKKNISFVAKYSFAVYKKNPILNL